MKGKTRRPVVAILMGGPSNEHEVSRKTGMNVLEHLDRERYEPLAVTISREGAWSVGLDELAKEADLAFIALHGAYGEDGGVQRELAERGIRYTGSGAHESALGFNKFMSLQALREAGLTTPHTLLLHAHDWRRNPDAAVAHIATRIGFPAVVKPNRGGSSIGVYLVRDAEETQYALVRLFADGKDVIAQPFIEGKELTCGVLDMGMEESAYALPPVEIRPRKSAFFDYDEKYRDDGAEEIVPARLSDAFASMAERIAKRTHHTLHLRHLSRTDMILGRDGNFYVLETNTIPGMTKTSLLPKAAEAAGVPFGTLIDRIIRSALS